MPDTETQQLIDSLQAEIDNITVDLRPGGSFETTMVSDADGSTYTMRAVYVEVRRPERLVWIEPEVEGGMRTTITFVDLHDGRTEVVTHQTNVPAAYLSAEARAGFSTSLDRFARGGRTPQVGGNACFLK